MRPACPGLPCTLLEVLKFVPNFPRKLSVETQCFSKLDAGQRMGTDRLVTEHLVPVPDPGRLRAFWV